MKTAYALTWPGAAEPAPSFRSHARGIARLNILLSDGTGPCYVRIRRNALTDALQEISQWLTVPQ